MPKENIHYSCIVCITIDSVINFNKKTHPQVYLEESKSKIKKTQMPKFIKNKLKSDSESDFDSDDKKLKAKLKDSDCDYDSDLDLEAESKSNAKLMTKLKKFKNVNIIIDDCFFIIIVF